MKRYRRKKLKTKTSKFKIAKIIFSLFFLILIVVVWIVWKISTLEKFAYVNRLENNDTEIVVIDSKNDKVIKFLILGSSEVNSARSLGEYKLESLWILGEKEGYGGKLVTETLLKNYSLPIYLWRSGSSWKNGNSSNLSFLQKAKVLFTQKSYIGYENSFESMKLPNSILINFVDPLISKTLVKVEIEDLTGNLGVAESVAKVIEIMGAKITSNSKGYDENLDCEVVGKEINLVKIMALQFDCKYFVDRDLHVDIKLRLGAKFGRRF